MTDIVAEVSRDRATSMFVVVELLLRIFMVSKPHADDMDTFLAVFDIICGDKKLQKISHQYLDDLISALNFSKRAQSEQLLNLLKAIKSSKKLSTHHENVFIIHRKALTVTKTTTYDRFKMPDFQIQGRENQEYKYLYTFKHPALGTCTEEGKCGFILKIRADKWTVELCTRDEDYVETGIHFHDIVSAEDMFCYSMYTAETAAGDTIRVAGAWKWDEKWLQTKGWKFFAREIYHIAYNCADYMVAKQN